MGLEKFAVRLGKSEALAKWMDACGAKFVPEMKPQCLMNIKGLQYKPLTTDTIEIASKNHTEIGMTNTSRWNNPLCDYKPKSDKDTYIPMQGAVDCCNKKYRNFLRNPIYNEQYANQIRAIDESFIYIRPLEKDCIGYRGISKPTELTSLLSDWENIMNAKPGDIIIPDIGYSYVSYNRELAESFARGDDKILIKYLFPKGAKISRWRNKDCGIEYLTPRNQPVRVIENSKKGNITEVTFEYILPERDNLAEIESIMKKLDIPINKSYRQSWIDEL